MKRFNLISIFVILIITVMAFLSSCGSDEPEGGKSGDNNNELEYSLSPTEITLACDKNVATSFKIAFTKGDAEWVITEVPDFVTVSSSSGKGSSIITVSTKDENHTLTPRQGYITTEVNGAIVKTRSIRVIQQGLEDIYAQPVNFLSMSDGLAFEWECGKNTNHFYWEIFSQSDYDKMSENDVKSKVISSAENLIVPSQKTPSWINHLNPDTRYVIITVSFDNDNHQGEMRVTPMTTKPTTGQPEAIIDNVSYYREDGTNNYNYGWNIKMNTSCQRYYTYVAASTEMFHIYSLLEEGRTVQVAWYLRNEIQKNGATHSTSINNGYEDMPFTYGRDQLYAEKTSDGMSFFTAYPETDKFLIIITWGVGNGDYSGIINFKCFDLTEE